MADPRIIGSATLAAALDWDEATGQYYLPRLSCRAAASDWRKPNMQAAMREALRFWLRQGVDGFRVDVMWHLIKDAAFRDNPPNPAWPGA
jgi:alpha-glucosidase